MREVVLAAKVLCPHRHDANGRYQPFKTHTLLSVEPMPGTSNDLPSSWGSD